MKIIYIPENENKNSQIKDENGRFPKYDWRSSVDKADVMRTMEAIEGKLSNHNFLISEPKRML